MNTLSKSSEAAQGAFKANISIYLLAMGALKRDDELGHGSSQ